MAVMPVDIRASVANLFRKQRKGAGGNAESIRNPTKNETIDYLESMLEPAMSDATAVLLLQWRHENTRD